MKLKVVLAKNVGVFSFSSPHCSMLPAHTTRVSSSASSRHNSSRPKSSRLWPPNRHGWGGGSRGCSDGGEGDRVEMMNPLHSATPLPSTDASSASITSSTGPATDDRNQSNRGCRGSSGPRGTTARAVELTGSRHSNNEHAADVAAADDDDNHRDDNHHHDLPWCTGGSVVALTVVLFQMLVLLPLMFVLHCTPLVDMLVDEMTVREMWLHITVPVQVVVAALSTYLFVFGSSVLVRITCRWRATVKQERFAREHLDRPSKCVARLWWRYVSYWASTRSPHFYRVQLVYETIELATQTVAFHRYSQTGVGREFLVVYLAIIALNGFTPVVMVWLLRRQAAHTDRQALGRWTRRLLLFDCCCDCFYSAFPLLHLFAYRYQRLFVWSRIGDPGDVCTTLHIEDQEQGAFCNDVKAYLLQHAGADALLGGVQALDILFKFVSRVYPIFSSLRKAMAAFRLRYVLAEEHLKHLASVRSMACMMAAKAAAAEEGQEEAAAPRLEKEREHEVNRPTAVPNAATITIDTLAGNQWATSTPITRHDRASLSLFGEGSTPGHDRSRQHSVGGGGGLQHHASASSRSRRQMMASRFSSSTRTVTTFLRRTFSVTRHQAEDSLHVLSELEHRSVYYRSVPVTVAVLLVATFFSLTIAAAIRLATWPDCEPLRPTQAGNAGVSQWCHERNFPVLSVPEAEEGCR